jgi:hypothetical protein
MTARTVSPAEAAAMEAERERQLSALEARMLPDLDRLPLLAELRQALATDDGWSDAHVLVRRETLAAYLEMVEGGAVSAAESSTVGLCRCGHPRSEHTQGEADGCLHGWGVPGEVGCFCSRLVFPLRATA